MPSFPQRPERIAVTGLGALCGLGHSLDEVWPNLVEGKSGISVVEEWDTSDISYKIAGEVKGLTIDEDILKAREVDRYDRFLKFALKAGHEAYRHSGVSPEHYPHERMGCILGVGMGGFPLLERTHNLMLEKGARRISPFFIPGVIPNMASGLLSMGLHLRGPNYTISSACSSGAHAIIASAQEILLGKQDVMVTGGVEGPICSLALGGFHVMKAMSKSQDPPEKVSRPFDKERSGFIMGEGAGTMVLENYDKAKARGAKIYAELTGWAATSDAHHITAPHPEGLGALRCMKEALEHSELPLENIHYINAHGTSTPLGDKAETLALKNVFGKAAYDLHISSTKSMTGHLLGAAGGIEAVFSVMAIENQTIPPTINLDHPDPDCDLNYTPNKSATAEIHSALSNSFGFGGTNATLIFSRPS